MGQREGGGGKRYLRGDWRGEGRAEPGRDELPLRDAEFMRPAKIDE